MNAEILPVSLAEKAIVINYIHQTAIPSLVRRDYPSEQVLRILHRLGVWYSKPAIADQDFLNQSYIAFYADIEPIPLRKEELDREIAAILQPDKFTPYCYYLRGHYRILGCFAPNSKIAPFIPIANEYFTGAVPVQTKDYLHQESPLYYPPIFNVHKHMAIICDNFDNEFDIANNLREATKALADFYFWGLAIVHPFIGGNHRAYDRFIEYAFAKKGVHLIIPLNDTLNIPNDHPLNIALYQERRIFLEENGLDNQNFNMNGWKDKMRWLQYQQRLDEILTECLHRHSTRTEQMAQAILNWL